MKKMHSERLMVGKQNQNKTFFKSDRKIIVGHQTRLLYNWSQLFKAGQRYPPDKSLSRG